MKAWDASNKALLMVSHKTLLHYDEPVVEAHSEIRKTPVDTGPQRVAWGSRSAASSPGSPSCINTETKHRLSPTVAGLRPIWGPAKRGFARRKVIVTLVARASRVRRELEFVTPAGSILRMQVVVGVGDRGWIHDHLRIRLGEG